MTRIIFKSIPLLFFQINLIKQQTSEHGSYPDMKGDDVVRDFESTFLPFIKEEQERIKRVNVCASCHDYQKDGEIWKKVTDITGFAKTNEEHKKMLDLLLKKTLK